MSESTGPKTNPTGEHRRAESFRGEAIRLASLVERSDLSAPVRGAVSALLRGSAARFYRWRERTDEQKHEDLHDLGLLSQLVAAHGIKV